jgi:hypothetical protein
MMIQCSGDVNPQDYGGGFYQVLDPGTVLVVVVQPVQEHCHPSEAPDKAFWVREIWAEDSDVQALLSDPSFLSWTGLELYEGEGYGQNGTVYVPLNLSTRDNADVVAALVCDDVGYGLLDWDRLGNMSGAEILEAYPDLPDREAWLDADVDHDEWRGNA